MKLQIEHCPGEVQVTVRGPEDSAELQTIVALLQSESDRMWLLNEQQETVAVSPGIFCGQKRWRIRCLCTQPVLSVVLRSAWLRWSFAGVYWGCSGAENPQW